MRSEVELCDLVLILHFVAKQEFIDTILRAHAAHGILEVTVAAPILNGLKALLHTPAWLHLIDAALQHPRKYGISSEVTVATTGEEIEPHDVLKGGDLTFGPLTHQGD